MRRLALVLGVVGLLATRPANAWDSKCYVSPGAECAPGRETAANRWISPDAEHYRIFHWAGTRSGIPGINDPVDLNVYTQSTLTRQPAPFDQAANLLLVTREAGEYAQLPDFAFSLWDLVYGDETCPLPVNAGPADCHDMARHMGPVNSNHFLPQAEHFYFYYHGLALDRAKACKAIKDAVGTRGDEFQKYLKECRYEAFALEAIADHYLGDAWSSGHMWERWGSPDLADFGTDVSNDGVDIVRARLVAATSGMIHGADALLAGQFSQLVPDDAMCAPWDTVTALGPSFAQSQVVGDLYLTNLLTPTYLPQLDRLMACAVGGLVEVDHAAGGDSFGGSPPTSDFCFSQRSTNAAIQQGFGIDYRLQSGGQHRLDADNSVAARLVYSKASGGSSLAYFACTPDSPCGQSAFQYRMAMTELSAVIHDAAVRDPNGTDLATGGMHDFLGMSPNSTYASRPSLAPYLEPSLPWPGAGSDAHALALARAFHRAHAQDWCARATSGGGGELDLTHLRDAQQSPVSCGLCAEFAARHLRVGTSASDYDATREPLCELLAPGAGPYLYQAKPATGPDDIDTLARSWCGCGLTTVVKAGSSADATVQTGGNVVDTINFLPSDLAPPATESASQGNAQISFSVTQPSAKVIGINLDADCRIIPPGGYASIRAGISLELTSAVAGTITIDLAPSWLITAGQLRVEVQNNDNPGVRIAYHEWAPTTCSLAAPDFPISVPIAAGTPLKLGFSIGTCNSTFSSGNGSGPFLTLTYHP